MTFGEELRRERELRGISLREVAQATKINLRYLEALERNDFAYLPGGLFNRGFVRAYCKHIGVDGEAMVNAYLLEERTQAGAGESGGVDRGPISVQGQISNLSPALLRGRAVQDDAGAAAGHRRRRRLRLLALVLAAAVIAAGAYALFRALAGAGDSKGSASSRALPAEVGGDEQDGEGRA